MKRKILDDLLEWKRKKEKRILVLLGPRGIGKTYIVNKFAKEYYDNIIDINFEEEESDFIFDGDYDLKSIMLRLYLYKNNGRISKTKSLIFFDEIQANPKALSAIKHLAKQKDYDIIISGSMLGNMMNKLADIQNQIEVLVMKPLDFEEFLWANNVTADLLHTVRENFVNGLIIKEDIHFKLNELFLKYLVVGGMPEAVKSYASEKNLDKVHKILLDTIQKYRQDLDSYALKLQKDKISSFYTSIYEQLTNVNKKFSYKHLLENSNMRYFNSSLNLISENGLASLVYRIKEEDSLVNPKEEKNIFKIYLNDHGLLLASYDKIYQKEILNGNISILNYAVLENAIFNILQINKKAIHYYEKLNTEIDFLVIINNELLPIEFKPNKERSYERLKLFMKRNEINYAIKLTIENVNFLEERIKLCPYYMLLFI